MGEDSIDRPGNTRPEITRAVCRGARRWLASANLPNLAEMPLPDGRRADIMAIDAAGIVTIVEVKSSVADYQADAKWTDYRGWCDRFIFAIPSDFPHAVIAGDSGLLIADAHGAHLLREGVEAKLAPARRRSLLVQFARLAARRLMAAEGIVPPDL